MAFLCPSCESQPSELNARNAAAPALLLLPSGWRREFSTPCPRVLPPSRKFSCPESGAAGHASKAVSGISLSVPELNNCPCRRVIIEQNSAGWVFWLLRTDNNRYFCSSSRIVICDTLAQFVSLCGRSRPLLLASCHCYAAHFQCEQELNSTCSRRILAQHIRCCRHALLSNARLTFPPSEVLRHSPPAQSRAPLPSSHCGETQHSGRDDGHSH
jgi:hypothetical protein